MLRLLFIGNNTQDVASLARYLERELGFTKMSLKDGAKKVVRSLYFVGGYKALKWEQLNNIYDAMYKVDPKIWVKYLEYRLSKASRDIVVTDVRYSNEAIQLIEMGFIIVRISSAQKNLARSLGHKRNSQDPADGTILIQEAFTSKAAPYKVSYSIYNDSISETRKTLERIVLDLRNKSLV